VSVPAGAAVALAVLSLAGCLPVLALVGFRWYAVPLCPLLGAVVAAVAATACVGIGDTTMTWFVVVSALGAAATVTWWGLRPDRRPWATPRAGDGPGGGPGHRLTSVAAVVGVIGASAWCLRALATPTVGFDTRAIWLMRAGWFLQPHQQVLTDLSSPGIFLPQTSYPPLVSAAGSVAWYVSGNHSMRLGVVVIALLNTCALAAAAFAVAECGRRATGRLWRATRLDDAGDGGRRPSGGGGVVVLPSLVGVAGAVALVFVTFAVAEPFMTNGYADPLWSLAVVGAVAYGLQMPVGRGAAGAAAILVMVAGMSKEEGAATAVLLIVVLVVRRVTAAVREPGRRWWRPVLSGLAGLVGVGAWPGIVRLRHLRPVTTGSSPSGAYIHRFHQAVDGLAPYWHVLLLAVPLALVGAAALAPVRRAAGMGHDGWGWAALVAVTAVIVGAYVTGTADVASWLTTTAHRVTECTALSAWWIIAQWAVTAAAAPAWRRAQGAGLESAGAPPGAGSGDRFDELLEGTGTTEVEALGEFTSHGP